jgi:hypothetical protein
MNPRWGQFFMRGQFRMAFDSQDKSSAMPRAKP